MSEIPGSVIAGRYEVLRVHPGGMGVVSIVRDRETGERYAAKSIREDLRADVRIRRRFGREVETWIGLGRHENVVEALFTVEDGGVLRLFLEAVDGTTLAELLASEPRLCLPAAVDLAGQFALGLRHAHESPSGGVIHRDVKPANLFVTRDRVGKVSDFGIARMRTAALETTAEGIGAGTPLYVSPEQLKGVRALDGRTDVYSFGAVLFEMLTGELPLRAESLESQIYLVLRRDPAAPRDLNPAVPRELSDLVLACLAKSPADRPDGFRPILESLVRIRESLPEDAAASCPSCGFASSRPPGPCPVCGGTTGEPAPFVPRFADEALEGEPEVVPARLSVPDVVVEPAVARVGEKITVRVALRNRGTVAARQVEVPRVAPDRDVFPLLGPDEVWRGEVPPTPAGRTFDVSYSFVPLREGTYDMPASTLRYHG
ncbi:MAG: protein kinase, partial [Planctomycetota bacterium]